VVDAFEGLEAEDSDKKDVSTEDVVEDGSKIGSGDCINAAGKGGRGGT